jgi:hypothetical protein
MHTIAEPAGIGVVIDLTGDPYADVVPGFAHPASNDGSTLRLECDLCHTYRYEYPSS